jgi:hypothetical protein
MNEDPCRSEVAWLMRRIEQEYEAAMFGLNGLAMGTARHTFISKRVENIARCHEQLRELIGEHDATVLVDQAMRQADKAE